MNDMFREFASYGRFLLPLLRAKKEVTPERVQWGNKQQYYLHYKAPERHSDLTVLYLHGGGWNSKSAQFFDYIGQFFARNGFDCVLMNYRKVPNVRYPVPLEDVFEGFCELRRRHTGGRQPCYAVIGSSAGAHLGALLCFDAEMQRKYKVSPNVFRGYIGLAAPLCFDAPRTWMMQSLLKGLFHSGAREDWKQGEPVLKLRRGQKVPVLLIHSRHDGVIGLAQAKKFCAAAARCGIRARLCEVDTSADTHTAYSCGIFFEQPDKSRTLDWLMKQLRAWSVI
jgi:acetyl esterase/lipase